LLDGKALARQMQSEIAAEVAEFILENGETPHLAAVLIGEDPASEVYVRNKRQDCQRAAIESTLHRLPPATTQEELLKLLAKLNKDRAVHGILVQLPLPKQIDESRILQAVSPLKDVDAFHPENVGRIVQGKPRFLPCTPHGIVQLLVRNQIPIASQQVVVVGRSDIVGKPVAIMLMQKGYDATVTVCHSRTKNLSELTRAADILIVAIGKANFITAEMVRPGAVVVDVGINRTDRGLVGDVDFEGVKQVAGAITPVPGGVGPMTRTMLLRNTLTAACQQQE
jgi:methylenetetrahydrofolate dehydrogenase (NADP+)/methenyltetrahydrofolate cyclohydrolase